MKKNTINGVGGDSMIVARRIKNVDPSDLLVKAWLTMKAAIADADPGVVQRVITTTYSPGNGEITDPGTTDGVAEIYFELSTIDTANILNNGAVYYDIQVKTDGGGVYTPEIGTLNFRAGATITTA